MRQRIDEYIYVNKVTKTFKNPKKAGYQRRRRERDLQPVRRASPAVERDRDHIQLELRDRRGLVRGQRPGHLERDRRQRCAKAPTKAKRTAHGQRPYLDQRVLCRRRLHCDREHEQAARCQHD